MSFVDHYRSFLEKRKSAFFQMLAYLPFLIGYLCLSVRSTSGSDVDIVYTNWCMASLNGLGEWECNVHGSTNMTYAYTESFFIYSVGPRANTIKLFPVNYGWLFVYIYISIYAVYFRCISVNTVSMIINFGCRVAWFTDPKRSYYNQLLIYVDSVGIVVAVLDLILHFKYIHGLRTLWATVVIGLVDGIAVLIMLANIFVAYAFAFHIVYGGTTYGYRHFNLSLQQLLQIVYSNFAWEHLASNKRPETYILWPTLAILTSIILQNVYVAIFSRAFSLSSYETKIEKMLQFPTNIAKVIVTYVRLYSNKLHQEPSSNVVISNDLQSELQWTVGLGLVNSMVDEKYDNNIILRDLFEQYEIYEQLVHETPYVNFNYDKFRSKFKRTLRECIEDVAYAPVYLLTYVASIVFAYGITNQASEIRLYADSCQISPYRSDFDNTIVLCTNATCISTGSIINANYGRMITGTLGTYESLIWMGGAIVIYTCAALVRRNAYVLTVTSTLLVHYFVRISIIITGLKCDNLLILDVDRMLSAIIIILESFGLLLIFSTNRRVRFIYATIKYASVRMRSVFVMVTLLIFAYGSSAFVLFRYDNYADTLALAFNQFACGNVNFVGNYQKEPMFAMVWFLTLSLIGTLIFYNMIIAILTDAYAHAATKIYNNNQAKRALGVTLRIPLEFAFPYNIYVYRSTGTHFHERLPLPEKPYNQFLIKEFGKDAERAWAEIQPTVEIFGNSDHIAKEMWLRALDAKHVISI